MVDLSSTLAAVPAPSERRMAVRITPDALRHVRARHPWVFEESVTSISHEAVTGDVAVIFDADRSFAAVALYDPESPIQFRVLHVGKPTPIVDAWWTATFQRALEARSDLLDDPDAERLAYRVINGENDGCSGFVVDRYAEVLVVKLYSAVWVRHLSDLIPLLINVTGCSAVVLRLARNLQKEQRSGDLFGLADGDVIAGQLAGGPVQFVEGGLLFEADVRGGQKTGHFLDQRENRARVREMAAGRDVLDLFASTGGFSVNAAAGGARSVHSVDLSAPTLAAAERNMELNNQLEAVRNCDFTTEVGDAFEVMVQLARAEKTYDLVIVDPPSFAQRAANVDGALRAYTRLTHLALRLVRPGGVLVQASCSSRVTAPMFFETVLDAADAAGRSLTEIERTGHAVDHPVGFPEGAYLKAGFWTVH
ncbi:MAG: class I SAM-dependent rRNA methyltransferase [Ilumatobacteraceae bacterium]|nr:class I SAM-dependent rRNA methyltransferase [Ilumatobacteraceae bacterium]